MKNMFNCMQKKSPFKRLVALLLAACLLFTFALGETQDDAMNALSGNTDGNTDGFADASADGFTDASADGFTDATGDGFTDPIYTDPAYTQQTYVQSSIDMDADLKVGYVAVGDINPFVCTDRDLVSLNQLVFESVVELDDDMKPTPLLADSWSNDGKTWTFKLRDGVVFHNGASLTAYEVLDSYNRFLLTNELNPYYERVQMIESMEVQDNLTLVVHSKVEGYVTLYAMTFPVVQSSTMDDSMARGTGPYWYTQYVSGYGVRLEANPLWWKNDPEIHSIAAVNFAETGVALEALDTGVIDLMCTQSNSAALHKKFSTITSMDYTTTTFETLIPNLSDNSVMADVRMRQAVMYAIDRAVIASNAYNGMAVQCEVPVNPSSWLYESQSAVYYYSPERALQLVQSCGWSDLTNDGYMNQIEGVRLKDLSIKIVTYNESTNNVRENAANLIADYLRAVGFQVEVEVHGKARALRMINEKDYDLALVGFQLSEIPDLSEMLGGGGDLNLNNFRNETMEELLDQISDVSTEEELKNIYSQIQMIVVERLPVLGLVFRTGSVLSTRSLSGLSGLRMNNALNGIEFMSKEE